MDNNDRILLVEGQDDKHVVRHLRNFHQPMPKFCILDKDNVEKVLDSIVPEIRVSGRQAVGILVDANESLADRWKAVAYRLEQVGLKVPRHPEPAGTIIDGTTRTPRVGIWLMPDNTSPGELENFVSEMIPDDDPVWPRSQSYIDGIPKSDRKFTKKKVPRAKVHAWLATREEPRKMGVAIGAQDLHVDGTLSTTFASWLRQLFE